MYSARCEWSLDADIDQVKEKRLHVPLVDRIPEEAPPIVVALVGPPGVGKTTLLKSLIRRYTKQTLTHPSGPITIVTSKRRRLTFIECPSDSLASMIDIAKVVDIVLLMIDGNYGFEMETMEFLNVLSASGMPGNVFGILTHLDLFKKQDTLKAQKKRLKHRFWSELYHGAKLFYLSGVVNGRYPDREILNMSRFLSIMKNPRPLVWRNSHPYCLADRYLDVTPPTLIEENPKCDRTVALYGYLRGTNFSAQGARVHIPGLGDLSVSEVEGLPDPCPTPFLDQAIQKATGKTHRRRLGEKQKVMYAPMSDVGGVLVDKDAVYVDVKSTTFDREIDGERGMGEKMVMDLQSRQQLLGHGATGLQLFGDGEQVAQAASDDEGSQNSDELPDQEMSDTDEETEDDRRVDRSRTEAGDEGSADEDENLVFADSDSDLGSGLEDGRLDDASIDDEDVDEGTLRWKSNLADRASHLHGRKQPYRVTELARILYNDMMSVAEVLQKWKGEAEREQVVPATDDDEEFFGRAARTSIISVGRRSDARYNKSYLEQKWSDHSNIDGIRSRFTSAPLTDGNDEDDDGMSGFEDGDEDEGDGEFEDLESGVKVSADSATSQKSIDQEREQNARKKEELKLRFEEEDREGFMNDKANTKREAGNDQEFGEDDWYDMQKAQIQKQLDINRNELDQLDDVSRIRVQGYKAGTYAKIILEKVPYEFCANFDPRHPILIGGLSPTEDRFGYVQVRIKRHRWHKKILKTNDPLIFSLGWRRFQTTPIYSISDSRTRNRMLKYTPEHMHCFATFYGPLIAPNTGFCCVQSFSNRNSGFRVAATGVVLNVDESTEIVKKLKLTGHPYKIFKNTAFIKDMFSTSLEITKFEGASIKTVSGIRGQIKKALSKPEGHFRATFEDKVLMSDIVFLRAWYPIRPHRYYNPVTNLLDKVDEQKTVALSGDGSWQGMRLTGQVRAEESIPTPQDKNSAYRTIERQTRHFNPLRVPRKIQADLPYKSQISAMKPQKKDTYLQKRAVVVSDAAGGGGSDERAARNLLQQVLTLRNEKVEKRRLKQEERRKPHRAKVAENDEKRRDREKREKEEYWRREGKKRRAVGDADGGERPGRFGKKAKKA